ncbi:protein arginine methyltransferase NDUFAF7 homolog, mitochondrial [Phymastichus coffea]|uniref:protein arginine methyltransferase NDUFAF7 homolog, mitochondrial n=1 Tax=Phymastichus coffea TaxID=108790 RepID=UPI00273AEE5F|nr:protein arginine methyltransferase NDUFAF7 homolog, mitochondrial [Phymastichus coffea]
MNNIIRKVYHNASNRSHMKYHFDRFLFISTTVNKIENQSILARNDINNDKNSLSRDLAMKIKLSGPVSVAHYMKQVLTHPTKGYYINKDILGQEGDFTTSPEISQLFGEMIAVWIVSECKKMHGKPFQIVELGPGRGTLSNDLLRVFNKLKMSERISLHLVEVSPVLSEIQKKKLCVSESDLDKDSCSGQYYYKKGKTTDNVEVFWYKSIVDIPHGFSVFLAQEFFDALPIHKFQKTKNGWFEVLVDVDSTSQGEEKFRFVLAKTEACNSLISKDEQRDHIEVSMEAMQIIKYISAAITQNGGFSLIIDYGHDGEKTDTFRAFKQHKQCDPLLKPGSADLTADVDFSLLKKAAKETRNLLCYGPVTQQEFLVEMGINVRLMNLLKTATPEQKKQLESGYKKITGSEEMGNCFKVVSMFPTVLKDHLKRFPVHGFSMYRQDP